MSAPNPARLFQFGPKSTVAEEVVYAGPCKLWTVAFQCVGNNGGKITAAFRDASATGGGSTAKATLVSGTAAAVGQGYVAEFDLKGLPFNNGITVELTMVNGQTDGSVSLLYEKK